MTPTTRKRVLIGAGGIVALLVVVLLALPSLIDLNARKPEIVAIVKKVTGRELVLAGPISLSILPTPTVTLSGVKFFNVPGKNLLRLPYPTNRNSYSVPLMITTL